VVYLFLDACYLPVRQGTREKEGILCAYAILEDGRKVLLHLALGDRESYDAWLGFLHEMVARGLREPVLTISDGQPGLVKALGEVVPRFPGEAACLRLVFATLIQASESWHGVKMTPELLRELDHLRAGRAKAEERELVAV
jgi:hypothetical protein